MTISSSVVLRMRIISFLLLPVENVFREDKVVNGDMRDELVDLAPRKKDGQYLVPKTVE